MNKIFSNEAAQTFYEAVAASMVEVINASDYQSGFFDYYIMAYNEYIKSVDRFKPFIFNINDETSMLNLIETDKCFSKTIYIDLLNSCKFNGYQFFLYKPNCDYVSKIVCFNTLDDFKSFLLAVNEKITIEIIREPFNPNYKRLYKLMTLDMFI